MTNEEAIKVLNMVEAHGIADEAKQVATKALSQQIEIDEIEKRLETIMESDKRTMSNRFHDGEDGRYYDGYYDGIYASLKIIREKQR